MLVLCGAGLGAGGVGPIFPAEEGFADEEEEEERAQSNIRFFNLID